MSLASAWPATRPSLLPVSMRTRVCRPRRRISARSSTTHARHVDVEQHQIEPIALERREGLVAVDRERDLVLVVVPEPAENVRSIRTVAGSSSTIRMRLVERVSPGASSMAISETSHEVSSLTLGIVQGVVGALDQVGDVSGVVGVTGDAEARRQRSVLERIALDDRAHT